MTSMGRVELMPRFEQAHFEGEDPLADPQEHRPDRRRAASDDSIPLEMLRSTPTLMEEEEAAPKLEQTPSPPQHKRQPSEPRRLSSSLPASTAIVETLFGAGLGPCWGDFSCTYTRIRGRLYATSAAVLFYTNLLGFERRICLLLRDIATVELYRTTSLRFSTTDDDETYIFKSFNDREQVLHLINGLKMLVQKQQAEKRRNTALPATPIRSGNSRASSATFSPPTGGTQQTSTQPDTMARTIHGSHYGQATPNHNSMSSSINFQPILPLSQPSRQRAASDSILRLPRMESPLSMVENDQHSLGVPEETTLILKEGEEVGAGAVEDEDVATERPPSSLAALWERAKKPKQPPLGEVGIDGIVLPCDMDTFFQYFWADHAQHSLEYYQREYVKDQDVQLTGWDLGSDGFFRRTLQFRHPIQNSLGLGPSAADTTRQQKLRTYAGLGITLENKTLVAGIPAADSFYIQDHWVLEAVGENQVRLTVRYDTRFIKRSMFKSIISKSIRKETKEWMAGYLDMVQSVLAEKASHVANPVAAPPHVAAPALLMDGAQLQKAFQSAYRLFVVIAVAFFGLGLVACIHLYRLQLTIAQLHSDLQQLQVCQSEPDSLLSTEELI